jgi:anthranilate synthase component I
LRGQIQLQRQLQHLHHLRTALLKDGKPYVQAGGGWVNDSEPEAEFQETVNKSKAMLKAVALAETFAKTS